MVQINHPAVVQIDSHRIESTDGTRRAVRRDTISDASEEKPTSWKYNAAYNPEFLGAQRARAGEDY